MIHTRGESMSVGLRVTAFVANGLYVLDYRDLNTAGLLANSGTLHIGYTGKPL
jgi:hypothetical protein